MQNNLAATQERAANTDCLTGSLWLLHALLKLDQHNVGFFRWFLMAGRGRQKITKAVLATISLHDPSNFLRHLGVAIPTFLPCQLSWVARQLRDAKPHAILAAAFGDCPQGFLPAVVRSRFDHRASVLRLFPMFTEQKDRPKIRALAHCPLTDDTLQIADALPQVFLRPSFLKSVENPDQAKLVADTLDTVQQMAPCDPDRLERIVDMDGYRCFVKGQLRAIRLEPPVEGDNEMVPLMPSDFRSTGREMQNCLGGEGLLLEAVSRRLFFYRYTPEPGAIVSLRGLHQTDLWILDEIHGPRNRRVAPPIQDHIREWFLARGIPNLTPPTRPAPLEAVATLMTGPGLEDMARFVLD